MKLHHPLARYKWNMLITGLLLSPAGYSVPRNRTPAPSINFISISIDTALRLAKKSHKMVFVDAYAIWCAPCGELKRKTFKDRQVAAYFNTHYINISVDVEKGEGMKFAEQYAVENYPTLLFINEEGEAIKRIEGFIDSRQLKSVAKGIK